LCGTPCAPIASGRLEQALASTVEPSRSVRAMHRIAERSNATLLTGQTHAWPSFRQAPEHYD
jgi:hypothetical protein